MSRSESTECSLFCFVWCRPWVGFFRSVRKLAAGVRFSLRHPWAGPLPTTVTSGTGLRFKWTTLLRRAVVPTLAYCHGSWHTCPRTPHLGMPSGRQKEKVLVARLREAMGGKQIRLLSGDAVIWLMRRVLRARMQIRVPDPFRLAVTAIPGTHPVISRVGPPRHPQ